MISIKDVVNGRAYAVVFNGLVKMSQGGRAGVAVNPLWECGAVVARRLVVRMQACDRASYARRMRKLHGANWQPSDKPSSYACTGHPCVDVSLKSNEYYLRAWSCGVVSNDITVNGKPATKDELDIIARYTNGKDEYTFMRLPLAKIEHQGWFDTQDELG